MTIIIGYINKKDNSIFMAGDSRTCQDSYYDTMNEQKVFIKNGHGMTDDKFIIGASGTLRLVNILKYNLDLPKHPKEMSTKEYIYTIFIDSIRKCFEQCGLKPGKEPDQDFNGAFLVGYKGKLFEIGCDYAINESIYPFMTIGSGGFIAAGSLMTTLNDNISIEEKINKALEVTGQLDCSVGPPYYILKLKCN